MAPTSTRSDRAPSAPGRVAVLGDSITFQSQAAIRTALASVDDLTVIGRSGLTIEGLLPDARDVARTMPDVVVIDLGTNDALKGVTTSRSIDRFDAMLDLFPRAVCILVTVNTRLGDTDDITRARAINAYIEGTGRPVVDWDGTLAAALADDGSEPMLIDLVHPSTHGQAVLAGLIGGAVADATPATASFAH
jgi:lysophospholipase L1-like esterase